MTIRPGDLVQLRKGVTVGRVPAGRQNNRTARVRAILPDGGLYMERDLRGLRYWNITDVELLKGTPDA